MIKQTELLAPAGSMESFYAAVNSGADSVYLGGKNFNARQNSKNFDNDEMMDIIRYAHNKNVKVYVTLNTVLKDEEILEALNYAVFLYENDVDAVIVQDLGLLYLIKKHIPGLSVNMSTQSSVYDEYGVKFFDRYNVNKVIMARELSLGQLKEVVKNTNIDIEVFVHGALCACYSGQCYMSSFLGGRSGNRGKCAQPCRLSYSFYDKETGSTEEELGILPVLSMKDFKAGESIGELIEMGISTFKIEGRMKGPEYTSAVVEYYRKIIDSYPAGKKGDLSSLENKAVAAFSRGYTNGYLKPGPDDEMFARTSSGVREEQGEEAEDEIRDKSSEFSTYRRKDIEFDIVLKVGEKAVLKASRADGTHSVIVKSKEECETSEKNPATDEMIKEQLGKLGSTIYNLKKLNITADENVFLRKSTLNQLRRDATEHLFEAGAVVYDRPVIDELSHDQVFCFESKKQRPHPKISLKINSEDELYLVDKVKVKRVYIPYTMDMNSVKSIEGVEKYLWIPNVVSKADYMNFKKNMQLFEELFDGVCVNNPGTFHFFKQKSKLSLHCGTGFNIINSFSQELLREKGAESFSFSVEANIKDMESVMKNTSMRGEIFTHGYVRLMVMKNCPMSLMEKCRNLENCDKCSHKSRYALKDRKGMYFNIERENRLTHIYNSVPLSLIGKMNDFIKCGIEYFLIDTKWEENSEEVIDAVYCELVGIQTANILRENNFTRGHYLKNIL